MEFMGETSVNRKRIAQNTLMLYIRMGVVMLIGLYTSRVVLDVLGAVDYGLYNVIGGIVVAFAFFNGVMSGACNRYFAIELGKGDGTALKKLFSLNVLMFAGLALIVLVLTETLGLWLLETKMDIPADRMTAARFTYQFSMAAFIVNMLSTPFRAIIMAREKMKVFAYGSIVEVVLKLAIVYLLVISPFDKLSFYAALMFAVTSGVSLFYVLYCRRFYAECRFSYYWDKGLFKEICGYTGWNMVGAMAGVGNNQGLNILLNMFFGPAVNAARGMAHQVYWNINLFVQNFVSAANPQIIKSYASGERDEMLKLVFQTSKFSWYLLFALVLPVWLEAPAIIDFWLKDVPEHTVTFARLMLLVAMVDSLGYPLGTAVQATGRVKTYQIVVGGTLLVTLPVAYVLVKWAGADPETVFFILMGTSVLAQILRVFFVKNLLGMSLGGYLREVILPVALVTLTSASFPVLLELACRPSTARALCVIILSMAFVAIAAFTIGMNKSERKHILELIHRKRK